MKHSVKVTAIGMALFGATFLMPVASYANDCVGSTQQVKQEISNIYDSKIAKYRALKEAGATAVMVDLDGDGPEPAQEFRVDDVIAAFEGAKAQGISSADQSHADCEKAYKQAKKEAQIDLATNPVGTVVNAVLSKPLDKIGLKQGSNARGAIETAINPVKPALKVINHPKKVIKTIIHKPHRVLQPWKW